MLLYKTSVSTARGFIYYIIKGMSQKSKDIEGVTKYFFGAFREYLISIYIYVCNNILVYCLIIIIN